jgi:hypothetical protein
MVATPYRIIGPLRRSQSGGFAGTLAPRAGSENGAATTAAAPRRSQWQAASRRPDATPAEGVISQWIQAFSGKMTILDSP